MNKLVIGVDFGSDSCRALIVDTTTGNEVATYISFYPRWKKGLFCDATKNQYRQHPQDYIDSFEEAIRGAIALLPVEGIDKIIAIGIDTTGSTPCLTDKNGTPLALLPKYVENPNAMFFLWKDHTSIQEANEINELSRKWEIDYTSRSGGIYSSEWYWAKGLHALREDPSLKEDAQAIIEHCDWMPALLTGRLNPIEVKRSRCSAGHKAMWAEEWGGFPSQSFLSTLDPLLNGFAKHLDNETYTSDISAGRITSEWANRLGLSKDVEVSVGIIDAHAGATGAGIRANTMVKIVGTSTCDIVITPKEEIGSKHIPGISGQVDGSVIPGYIGLEAGQSAFGDIYAWFKNLLSWSLNLVEGVDTVSASSKILEELTREAEKLPLLEDSVIANDWLNGRRTPFANQSLKGTIDGLTLGTRAPDIFKSLVEGTAFGSRAIMEHLEKEGVRINEVIGVGGISLKSPYVMQTLSDVLGVSIKVAKTEQAGALGAAMYASVAAQEYNTILAAQEAMCQGFSREYTPNPELRETYNILYSRYLILGEQ